MDDRTLRETFRDQSAALLVLLEEMRDLEWRKRQERMAGPAFHDAADQAGGATEMFMMTPEERDPGDDVSGLRAS